jgi:hypothetical protein
MDEQLLDKILNEYGDCIYPDPTPRLKLGSYAGSSDIDPEFEITKDECGNKFVDRYEESKVLAACVDGFRKVLEEEDDYKDFDLSQITVENLGDDLAKSETISEAVYCYETWLNEDNDESDKTE